MLLHRGGSIFTFIASSAAIIMLLALHTVRAATYPAYEATTDSEAGITNFNSAVIDMIDAVQVYVYAAAATTPAKVCKINAGTFAQDGPCAVLETGADVANVIMIDNVNGGLERYAYTQTNTGKLCITRTRGG